VGEFFDYRTAKGLSKPKPYMDEDASELIERLKQYVTEEARAQREEIERQWALPLAERVRKGLAIHDLRLVEQRENELCILECNFNESRFREGDILVLHRGQPLERPAIECVLEYDDEEHLHVTLTGGDREELALKPEGWIADEGMIDLSQFYLKALDQIADSNLGRENILPRVSVGGPGKRLCGWRNAVRLPNQPAERGRV
jgi:DNA replication ATP-dependent helicase Dna2